MKQMGLPTMLINSYDDLEEEEVCSHEMLYGQKFLSSALMGEVFIP